MSAGLRLLIAENHATRQGIRMALGADIEICAEAGDCEQAIRAALREQPDACLVGRDIPGGGLNAVRGISRAAPEAAVVLLAQASDVDEMLECIRAGAVGYMPGGLSGDRLSRVVRALEINEAVVPRSLVMELLLELRGAGAGGKRLTSREAQVLRLVRRGRTTAEIAERLDIAPVTVRRHISAVMTKLGVAHRSMLGKGDNRWRSPTVTKAPGHSTIG
jgi:DNA-binding NarL/FixJ family response regulator